MKDVEGSGLGLISVTFGISFKQVTTTANKLIISGHQAVYDFGHSIIRGRNAYNSAMTSISSCFLKLGFRA